MPPTPTPPACSRKAGAAPRAAPPPPPPHILDGPAPQRACGARAGRPFGAIAFANRCAKPTRGRSRARSGRGAATSAADAGKTQPPGARSKRQPRLPGGQPQRRRRWLRRLDPSWLLQWPTSLPSDRRPAGPLRPWERRAARMKVCPDWRRSTRPRRSDRTRPTTGPRSTRRPLSRAVTMNLGNGPKRPKWRRSSTAPAWRPDRRRRCSARSRQAPKSPSRSACSGSRRRSSLELSLRWPEPQS